MTTDRRPSTKCRRCSSPYGAHAADACPDSSGRKFLGRVTDRARAGQSFTPAEVDVLAEIMAVVQSGIDDNAVARKPEFSSIARKVLVLRKACERHKAARREVIR